ncbi:MAG: class I SAM-dependent methyltransferase family protein [Candidatus Micrarchaeota archaeon]|nr:class I SAM-dependent methyltransferase family protein [Candidatus Micrarchaeota archaeon]
MRLRPPPGLGVTGRINVIGDIALVKLSPGADGKRAGEMILRENPWIDSVFEVRTISGAERRPVLRLLAGSGKTLTFHTELGFGFFVDVKKFMWSAGNLREKKRLLETVRPDETVADLFAGIGYWTVPVGSRVKRIYSSDINPEAVEFLCYNLIYNRIKNSVVFSGDCRTFVNYLPKVDRIIMGYLFETEKFLDHALKICGPDTVVHLHRVIRKKNIDEFVSLLEKKFRVVDIVKVKSYSPGRVHFVFDLVPRHRA